ncbi:MAG TPA: Gfo/Idh/MocA family oxidoreductase [Verrucomicrobiae bacterium]|nr:Gfo/Idh/MocA family oxidoreductase [Verrucomicrobiae bacterium]
MDATKRVRTPMAKKLRVGLIGYKFMGKAHSNAWRQINHFFPELPARVELAAICGRDSAAVERARDTFGWERAETDWRKIIASPDIDIVDISTGNDTHCEMAVEALKAGKAVLCEKPLARNLAEARQMLAAARRAGTVNMVCHNYRRIPAVALAKQMIDSGELGGTIRHFHARYAQEWLVNPDFPLTWRMQKDLAGSGAHGDIDAHIIDLGRYLLGEVKEVCGMMETFIKERPLWEPGSVPPCAAAGGKKGKVTVDDAVSWIGRFENGAMANLEATRFALGRKNHIAFEINGDKGSLYFDFEDMNRLKFYSTADAQRRRGFTDIIVTDREAHPYARNWWPPGHIVGYEHTFVNTFADFVAAVAAKTPVHPDFLDGARCLAVMEAVAESSASRRWVKVPSVR